MSECMNPILSKLSVRKDLRVTVKRIAADRNEYIYDLTDKVFRYTFPQYFQNPVLHQLDQKIIYPHYDFKHLTEKYFEIGMKLNDFSIQLVKYWNHEMKHQLSKRDYRKTKTYGTVKGVGTLNCSGYISSATYTVQSKLY